MKKNLLWFILGGLIFGTIGVGAAYVYTARDINYQSSDENWEVSNVQEAISELKTDVNTITNKVEGIERVYKAGEVELVALVSDDSFYKDSNDKYVLSNSDTGRTLLTDTSTYKSLVSTEDCLGIFDADTVVPFSTNDIKFGTFSVTYPNSFTVDLGFEPKYLAFHIKTNNTAGCYGIYQADDNNLFQSKKYIVEYYANDVAHPDQSVLTVDGTNVTIKARNGYGGTGFYYAIK